MPAIPSPAAIRNAGDDQRQTNAGPKWEKARYQRTTPTPAAPTIPIADTAASARWDRPRSTLGGCSWRGGPSWTDEGVVVMESLQATRNRPAATEARKPRLANAIPASAAGLRVVGENAA